MRILIAVLLISITGQLHATVYRYVDEQGNVYFSDRKIEGATEQEVADPTVIEMAPAPKTSIPSESKTGPAGTEKEPEFKGYVKAKITAPQHDGIVRDNSGNVNVSIETNPPFDKKLGHKIQVFLDGQKLPLSFSESTFQLSGIDRGTHTIQLRVVDEKASKTLISSDKISFHMKRFFIR